MRNRRTVTFRFQIGEYVHYCDMRWRITQRRLTERVDMPPVIEYGIIEAQSPMQRPALWATQAELTPTEESRDVP